MLVTMLCWWLCDSDSLNIWLVESWCWWLFRCHQRKRFPSSVTDIDVARISSLYLEKIYMLRQGVQTKNKIILWATTVLSAPLVIQAPQVVPLWQHSGNKYPNLRKFEDALSDASSSFDGIPDLNFDYNSNYAQMLRPVFKLNFWSHI